MSGATRGLLLSEFIARLEAIRGKHGDVRVVVTDGDDTYGFAVDVNDVTVSPALVVLDISVWQDDAE